MSHLDSLRATFSQTPRAHPFPPAAPQWGSEDSFAQIWSAQAKTAAAPRNPSAPSGKMSNENDTQSDADSESADEQVFDDQSMPHPTESPKVDSSKQDKTDRATAEVDPQTGQSSATVLDEGELSAAGGIQPNTIDGTRAANLLAARHGPQTQSNAVGSALSLASSQSAPINEEDAGQQSSPRPAGVDVESANRDNRTSIDSQRPGSDRQSHDLVRQTAPMLLSPTPQAAMAAPIAPPLTNVDGTSDIPLDPELALAPTSQSQTTQPIPQTTALNRAYAPLVAQQIATAIVQSSGGRTEIMLNPVELGRVRIAMTAGDAGLVVTLFAERPETIDLMRRNIEHLTRELRDMGYDNPTFNFENQSDGSDDNRGEDASKSDGTVDLPVVEPATIERQRVALSGGLDLKL